MALVLPVRAVDVSRPDGRKTAYRTRADGTVEPRSAHDERALREAGAVTAGTAVGRAAQGRTCTDCGRVGFFVRCGRCGGVCS